VQQTFLHLSQMTAVNSFAQATINAVGQLI